MWSVRDDARSCGLWETTVVAATPRAATYHNALVSHDDGAGKGLLAAKHDFDCWLLIDRVVKL
jgi:hypothetical protein